MEQTAPEASRKPDLNQILLEMDEAIDWDPGPKPSEIWRYREEIRTKYGLPETINPHEYIKQVERLLKKEGISVRPKREFQKFFEENPEATAFNNPASVFRDAAVVVSDASGDNFDLLIKRAQNLGHEAVHALQDRHYPRMPLEKKEREAYTYVHITPFSIEHFKNTPGDFWDYIHGPDGLESRIKQSTQVDERLDPKASPIS